MAAGAPEESAYLVHLQTHFPQLERDCGADVDPGRTIEDEWRDWSDRPTTPDQLAIERYLELCELRGRRILHVGVGNSSLAQRFHGRAAGIEGLTVNPEEKELADRLALQGYRVHLRNKYLGDAGELGRPFDYIVDNNPTTFACCLTHFAQMMRLYRDQLAAGGRILTEHTGLAWLHDPKVDNPRWSFDFADWVAAGTGLGLNAYREGTVYILSAERPAVLSPAQRAALRLHGVRDRWTYAREIAR